ncbi:DEAD/DEAH box helicase [Candidatus Woesearchaeota archaeon]|nr:DEAD/DEAH box helicase [Candidatus Woesearchaeota archaeon]
MEKFIETGNGTLISIEQQGQRGIETPTHIQDESIPHILVEDNINNIEDKMEKFRKLGIEKEILNSIEQQGFDTPTDIQLKSIPHILIGRDVVGKSATGSGKTLAFGAGIIQNIKPDNHIQSLVLTPTRELADQVKSHLKSFSRHKKLKITAVYGGVAMGPQIQKLKLADIVVATPGRLLDHLQRGTINLSRVKILVLDEADRMLDMGFIDDVKKIIGQTPKKRQTLLFSATISSDIKKIEQRYLHNPIKVSTNEHVDPSKLRQCYYDVKNNIKFSLLVHLLENERSNSVLIFCNTRRQVDFISKKLYKEKIQALPIHGGFTQSKRTKTMDDFKSNDKKSILVCTDVAARGLDIKGVSHVYNYDLPSDSKEYIHRIGRTARAGKEGQVINILSQRDHDNFSSILRAHHKLKIQKMDLPEMRMIKDQHSQEKRFSPRRKSFGHRTDGNRNRFSKGSRRSFRSRR